MTSVIALRVLAERLIGRPTSGLACTRNPLASG
jgi:hypothetical protein